MKEYNMYLFAHNTYIRTGTLKANDLFPALCKYLHTKHRAKPFGNKCAEQLNAFGWCMFTNGNGTAHEVRIEPFENNIIVSIC